MTEDSEKWLNLFLAVEDIEKIKKSFNNLTTEMLHQKIINLQKELKKKVDKNKNQALEITKLLEQKKNMQEENSNLEKTIDNINLTISNIMGYPIDERCEKTSYLKAIEKKFEDTNNELARVCELNKYLKEAYEIKLQEKNTIISYLESKLK